MEPEKKVGEEEVKTPPEGEELPPEELPEDEPPKETEDERFERLAKEKGYIPQSAVQPRFDELTRKMHDAEREAEVLRQAKPATEKKEEYTEADLQRMVDYYSDLNGQSYNPQYAKWASDKLIDIKVEKKARAVLEEDKVRAQQLKIVEGRQQALLKACDDYPDLRNPQSALYILSDSIYRSKPWYSSDPEGLSIAVEKAAKQLGVIPKSGSSAIAKEKKKLMKEQDKVSLAAGGRKAVVTSPTSQLEKLEAQARQSGKESDWVAYTKALNAHKKKQQGG